MVGREQQIMVVVGSDEIRARTARPLPVTAGATVGLGVSLAGAKLFDAASGRALPPPR